MPCLSDIYTRDRNVCSRWPVCEVKCLFSRGQEWGREERATPTSIEIFDSYDMKTLWIKFGHNIFTGFKMPRLRALQFHFMKQIKNEHSNFKDLPFWSHWRYHDQILVACSSCHKNLILKSWWEWQLPLIYSYPLKNRHFTSWTGHQSKHVCPKCICLINNILGM